MKSTKTINDIILIGDKRLYEVCPPVQKLELSNISNWIKDLHNVLFEVKKTFGFGRGIAAPQLGIMKQLVYIHIKEPLILINPVIIDFSVKTFEIWDDCMSIPNLLVKVKRHTEVSIIYKDLKWQDQEFHINDTRLSELVQHEIDHLNGILCTMRAIDNKSFKIKKNNNNIHS